MNESFQNNKIWIAGTINRSFQDQWSHFTAKGQQPSLYSCTSLGYSRCCTCCIKWVFCACDNTKRLTPPTIFQNLRPATLKKKAELPSMLVWYTLFRYFIFNPRLTTAPLKNFSLPSQNQKESDQSHLGNLNYILCGHFDKKKLGVPPSGDER